MDENQDKGENQDQDKVDVDSILKEKAELEEKFKRETAGLNKKVSDLEKLIKAKEREGMDESAAKKAELDEILQEKERILKENQQLLKKRTVDTLLHESGLPLKLFEDRILGTTEEEIKADVEAVKTFIESEVAKRVEAQVSEALKGKTPGKQGEDAKKMTLEEIAKLPTREERTAAMKANGYSY